MLLKEPKIIVMNIDYEEFISTSLYECGDCITVIGDEDCKGVEGCFYDSLCGSVCVAYAPYEEHCEWILF